MMSALIALICFVLAAFGVNLSVNLIALGLALVAAHLLLGPWPLGGALGWPARSN